MSQRMGRDVPCRKKKEHYPLIVCFQFWFTTPMGDESVIAYSTSRHGDGNGERGGASEMDAEKTQKGWVTSLVITITATFVKLQSFPNKTKIYALSSQNGLLSTNSEISTKYRDHQIACHNDPTLRLGKSAEIVASGRTKEKKKYVFLPEKKGKEMSSGGSEKRRRKMKSVSFHSMWDVPKDGQGRAKQEKRRALPADCLFPVLVYDAHGRRKRYCIEHLETRGGNGKGMVPGKWMRSDLRFAPRVQKF
ncbi:hypothetical protein CEXT_725951 [Caerostris extrusa]|uniref:Uncharacterized protein n=1 Tax=Caerostris extrusa TaxID=172846 RepID=A0AAV4M4V8_CAEEX|nr:hypothetical protein CEXT_725951 [Caerostris extrusa]